MSIYVRKFPKNPIKFTTTIIHTSLQHAVTGDFKQTILKKHFDFNKSISKNLKYPPAH